MFPRYHILFGLIFSAVIWLIFPAIGLLGFLIIFLSSVLIDVDHYLYYIYKQKDFSLRKSIAWFVKNQEKFMRLPAPERRKFYSGLYFLHGIEAVILLAILSFISPIFIFILIGFVFHQILDAIEIAQKEAGYAKVISFIYAIYIAKNKKALYMLKR